MTPDQIKRYEMMIDGDMDEYDDGEWVLYTDIAPLLRLEELEAALAKANLTAEPATPVQSESVTAHSKSEFKRLSAMGVEVVPPVQVGSTQETLSDTPETDAEVIEALVPFTALQHVASHVVPAKLARTLEHQRDEARRELADRDTVPRSRYDACNQDWLNAKAELKEVREVASREIARLEHQLNAARHERDELYRRIDEANGLPIPKEKS